MLLRGVDGDLLQAATPSFSKEQRNARRRAGTPGAGQTIYRVSGLVQLRLWSADDNRKNRLFVGSQHAGERAAVLLSLIESAKLNGHDPWAYLKDVFERLPTLKNRDLETLLPHNWRLADKAPATVAPAACTTVPANAEPSAAEQHGRHGRRKVGWRNVYV